MEINTNEKKDTVITNIDSRIVLVNENGDEIKIKLKNGAFEVKYNDNKIVLTEGSLQIKHKTHRGPNYWI